MKTTQKCQMMYYFYQSGIFGTFFQMISFKKANLLEGQDFNECEGL